MAFTYLGVKFFFIGFLFSFGFVQNVSSQSTKIYAQSNIPSWQNERSFNEHWHLRLKNDYQGEEAVLHEQLQSDTNKTSELSDFDEIVLERHNLYRKKHRVPTLVYNKQISTVSQEWANKLAQKDKPKLQHRPHNVHGENLYYSWSSNPNHQLSPKAVVDAWYNEIKNYKYSSRPNTGVVDHFTQLVWKNSQELGIGVAKSKSNRYYVVCNYSPPGNVRGQYAKNVLPPTKS